MDPAVPRQPCRVQLHREQRTGRLRGQQQSETAAFGSGGDGALLPGELGQDRVDVVGHPGRCGLEVE